LSRKAIVALERQVQSFARARDEHRWLESIDGLEPSKKSTAVSYRYPFYDQEANYVAPAEFPDWDSHLGGIDGAIGAIEKMVRAVEDEFKAFKRKPG